MTHLFDIDDTIPFSKKHPNQSIREILATDSGYLRSLFEKNEQLVFSDSCFNMICKITNGQVSIPTLFMGSKVYGVPYLYDWNKNPKLLEENKRRINIKESEKWNCQQQTTPSFHEDEYAGTYAHDVAGFSDEEIDDIFDGEPDAYWNID